MSLPDRKGVGKNVPNVRLCVSRDTTSRGVSERLTEFRGEKDFDPRINYQNTNLLLV